MIICKTLGVHVYGIWGYKVSPIDAADMRTCSVVESRRSSPFAFPWSAFVLPLPPPFLSAADEVAAESAKAVALPIGGVDNVDVTKLNGKLVSVSTPFRG